MVLEYLFPEIWLKKRGLYAFLVGFGFSVLGIYGAWLLFPKSPALISVAFTAILLIQQIYRLFEQEVNIEAHEKKFTFRSLYKDNKGLIKAYFFLVAGIFLAYLLAAMVLPQMTLDTLFREQLAMRGAGAVGKVQFTFNLFLSLLINNWWVLLACFVLGLVAGDGAIFLITWNASVWGTIFGATARFASAQMGASSLKYMLILLATVLPHAIIEMMAYILAGIAGAVISKRLIMKSRKTPDVVKYLSFAFLFIILYSVYRFFTRQGLSTSGRGIPLTDILTGFFQNIGIPGSKMLLNQILGFIVLVIGMGIVVWLIRYLGTKFSEKKERTVYKYNWWLFIVALIFLFAGALLEALVLSNADYYIEMIRNSIYFFI